MKKPTCLILTGIGVLLLIVVIVFAVPWFVNIFQEVGGILENQEEYMRTLRQSANAPLTEEKEKLLSQLLEETDETSDPQNSENSEAILSTEPYLDYIKTQYGQEYTDFLAYVSAMPTQNHRAVVLSRLNVFFEAEIKESEQEIWVDFYYKIRNWSKTGKTHSDNTKEFDELLQKDLVEPLMAQGKGPSGFTTKILKMGMVSALMIGDTEVFHRAWHRHLQNYGTQEGYLRSAIATPAEFALMRSFFEDAAVFERWMTEPFRVEEDTEGQENK